MLLNWLFKPQDKLTVSVHNVGKFRKVSSIEGAALKTQFIGNDLKVTMPIQSLDVLMIE